jgi:hypothetical protein
MERIIYLLLAGFAIFLLLSWKQPKDDYEDDEYEAPPACQSCALTTPKKSCTTGMCSQKRGTAGYN